MHRYFSFGFVMGGGSGFAAGGAARRAAISLLGAEDGSEAFLDSNLTFGGATIVLLDVEKKSSVEKSIRSPVLELVFFESANDDREDDEGELVVGLALTGCRMSF